tara:strand:- start:82 stop:1017 length:936 start_codon:yes stop_codon:yes gene_type:complete
MARKRMISPDFWTDDKMLQLPLPARLMFIGMLNFADDEGLIQNNATSIKVKIFPAEDITIGLIEDYVRTMVGLKLLSLGTNVDGQSLIKITKWHDHQKINHPTPTKYIFTPLIEEEKTNSSRTKVELSEDSSRTTSQIRVVKNRVDKVSINKSSKKNQDFTFEHIYSIYPKKQNKDKSEKAFKRLTKKEMSNFSSGLLKHIDHWKRFDVDIQYIPLLSTFINGKRWNDELVEPTINKPTIKDPLDKEIFDRNRNVSIQSKRMKEYIKKADNEACDEIPDLNALRGNDNVQPIGKEIGQFLDKVKAIKGSDG